jgi:hypothetical protein
MENRNRETNMTSTLHDLARRIAVEHNAVAVALRSALAHAIAAGELLIEAKSKVRHGQWLKWLAANCETIPERTATHYMALARDRERLCDENGNVLPISVNRALAMLKWPYYGTGGVHEFENDEYKPREGWGCPAWGSFRQALEAATRLSQLNPPAARYVAKAARAGKTPGLTAAVLREVAALLTHYADAIEAVGMINANNVAPPVAPPAHLSLPPVCVSPPYPLCQRHTGTGRVPVPAPPPSASMQEGR